MPITAVAAFSLREPKSGRAYTLIQIKDSSGLSGWGEASRIEADSLNLARQILRGQEHTRYDVLTHQLASDPISGAINMALLDLCGKAAKAPVFQVLGGPTDRKSTRLNSSHSTLSRMPSSA